MRSLGGSVKGDYGPKAMSGESPITARSRHHTAMI
jgi:hypothetical protein